MGLFDRVEGKLDRVINGAFARAFKAEVQPVEIAAAMRRAMDERASAVGRGRTMVPNVFTIELDPSDYDRLTMYEEALANELLASVEEHVESQRYITQGPLNVAFAKMDDLDTGVFRVRPTSAAQVPERKRTDPQSAHRYQAPSPVQRPRSSASRPDRGAGAGAGGGYLGHHEAVADREAREERERQAARGADRARHDARYDDRRGDRYDDEHDRSDRYDQGYDDRHERPGDAGGRRPMRIYAHDEHDAGWDEPWESESRRRGQRGEHDQRDQRGDRDAWDDPREGADDRGGERSDREPREPRGRTPVARVRGRGEPIQVTEVAVGDAAGAAGAAAAGAAGARAAGARHGSEGDERATHRTEHPQGARAEHGAAERAERDRLRNRDDARADDRAGFDNERGYGDRAPDPRQYDDDRQYDDMEVRRGDAATQVNIAPPMPDPSHRPWIETNGDTYPLLSAITIIGRDGQADITLDDPGVSRRHAEVRVTHDGPHLVVGLRDLGSTNGTFVNGERVGSQRLDDGDRVTVGRVSFIVRTRRR